MATFGLKYYAQMRSKYQGILWRVEIAQRGYTRGSSEMTFSGISPVKVTWKRRGDDFYTPVKASEATINVLCTENFQYLGLFTSDPREYRMTLYRNRFRFWQGFIVADLYSEKFTAPPYDVSIKAADGFNIRRVVSLFDDYRPWHYANLLWDKTKLVRLTTQGKDRLTETSIHIVSTNIDRVLQNDMCDGGFYMIGESSTLDIVPPIRNIHVSV